MAILRSRVDFRSVEHPLSVSSSLKPFVRSEVLQVAMTRIAGTVLTPVFRSRYHRRFAHTQDVFVGLYSHWSWLRGRDIDYVFSEGM